LNTSQRGLNPPALHPAVTEHTIRKSLQHIDEGLTLYVTFLCSHISAVDS